MKCKHEKTEKVYTSRGALLTICIQCRKCLDIDWTPRKEQNEQW